MTQLTDHQIHTIEDKILEGWGNIRITSFIKKDRSILYCLFKKYPRESFHAEAVIQDHFCTKSTATKQHARIEPGGELALYIHKKFLLDWSPEQITESWKKKQKDKQSTDKPSTEKILISVKLSKDTVYDWIYRYYDPKDLKKHMRRKNKEYRDRKKEAALGGKYQIQERTMIDEREKKYPETTKRGEQGKRIEEIGHWEGDTIIGKDRKGTILTLVERKTGQTLIGELPMGKRAEGLTSVLIKLMKHIPRDKLSSIIFDNGREFADHKMMQYELSEHNEVRVDIYFAHPYHSWERGTNENTNGLIRQYLPKKTDFTDIKQKDLDKIQILLNSRPRKQTRLCYSRPDVLVKGKVLRFRIEFTF